MFEQIDIKLHEEVASLPPTFSANDGWFGENGSILDLLYRTLAVKRLKDEEKAKQ